MPPLLWILCLMITPSLQAGGWGFHLITAQEALKKYPDSPLKSLLLRQKTPLQNGLLYPDGGYMTGDREASEWMHERNFFTELLSLLEKQNCHQNLSSTCEEQLAFALGVLAHQVEDQHFDAYFVKGLAEAEFRGDLRKAEQFTDIRFDTVILHHYKEFERIPPLYDPKALLAPLFQKKGYFLEEGDLFQMQIYQRVLYSALTLYSPHAAKRIAKESPWASRNFVSGRGGVEETSKKVQEAWWEVEKRLKEEKKYF